MALHDVAVGTSRRVVGQIRRTFRVDKGVRSDAKRNADEHAENDGSLKGAQLAFKQLSCGFAVHSPELRFGCLLPAAKGNGCH